MYSWKIVQQGWYDLATPHFIMKHDIGHLRLTPDARARIEIEHCEAAGARPPRLEVGRGGRTQSRLSQRTLPGRSDFP